MTETKRNAAAVALGGLKGYWASQDNLKSPDKRFKAIVNRYKNAG